MRHVPPVVVSNSQKSSCQIWFAPEGSVANAAFPRADLARLVALRRFRAGSHR